MRHLRGRIGGGESRGGEEEDRKRRGSEGGSGEDGEGKGGSEGSGGEGWGQWKAHTGE